MELRLYLFGLLTGQFIGETVASSFTMTEQWDDIATSSFTISKDTARNPYQMASIPIGTIVVVDKHQLAGSFFASLGWGGAITEIKESESNYAITARGLRSLLKSQTSIDTASMGEVAYAKWFANMLGEILNTSDSAQNYSKWLYRDSRNAPNDSGYLPSHTSNDIIDWNELLQECMDLGRFVINYRFEISTDNKLSTTMVFTPVTDDILDINTSDGFISRPIFSQGSSEAVNKYIVKPSADNVLGSDTLIFYLHTDGTVSDVDEDRVTPVVEETAIYTDSDYYSAEDFYQTSLANAKTAMSADDDSETTFTLYENRLLTARDFSPRQNVRIWQKGMTEPFVNAQLSKIEYKDSFTELTLTIGYKKTRLTDKLSQNISKVNSLSNSTSTVSRNATSGNSGNAPKAGEGIIVTDNTKVSVDFNKVQSRIKVGTKTELEKETEQKEGDFYIVEGEDKSSENVAKEATTLEAKVVSTYAVSFSPPSIEAAGKEEEARSSAPTLWASSNESDDNNLKNESTSLTFSNNNAKGTDEDTGSSTSTTTALTLRSSTSTGAKSDSASLTFGK